MQLNGQSRVLLLSALGFDLTQKNLFIPFCTGAALVIPDFEDYDPERLGHLIAQQNVSVINCAPSAFYPLVEQDSHPGYPFASLRHVVLGGEPIRLGSLKHWFDAPAVNCTLTNSYGPTECTDVVAYCSLQQIDDIHRAMPIGRALPNTQLFIVNQQGALMPTGATGELCVAGIGVGTGYLNRPELNEQSFQPARFGTGAANWYRTGDLVRYNDAGELVYVGRKDFQVKLRGLRIEPGEIDSILKTLAHVRDALTLVVDDRLVSYVIAPRSFDIPAGRDALRKQLPEFMVPGAIVLLDAWPLTPNGKIDRKALPKPDARDQGAHVPPRNDSEQRIADIWCQVLKLSQVSVTANFFEVGGHSLLATQVVSRIRQAFGVELSVRTLFESPTIEKLTHAISSAAAAGFVDTAPPIVPLDPPNRDTLSFAQYRLWFVDQLNQGSSEYNLPSALKISGPLDVAVLDRVFGEIVRRHEVLRTNFAENDGVPQLCVREPGPWHSTLTDLSGLDKTAQQKEVERLVDQDANVTFSLANDPLFTTRIVKLSAQEHILLLNMHHIISDGWSLTVLVQEIQALYLAFAAGRASPLPELPIQYSDFAVWQRNWLQGDTLDKLRNYWKDALNGAPDVLRMPTDKPRPKIQTFNGAHFPLSLGPALAGKVKRYCEQHDLTPFMVLMGAYHVLLSRYSNQQDICVGIPIAGRNRAEIEGLIGFFVNGLVFRSRLDGNPSVEQYFRQIKQVALGAYTHQDMPADLLLDAIKMERSADTSPGAQVGFALQNVAETDVQANMAGLSIETVPREHKTAKYELSLILQEGAGDIAGVMEYNTDLFVASTIERMLQHYRHILEQMLDQSELLLDSIHVVELQDLYGLLKQNPADCELQRLSPMQRDMYLDSLLEPDTLKNSLGYHFITDGEFDFALWQRASQQLVDSQPMLRAQLLRADIPYADVAYLRIAKRKQVHVAFEDWSARSTSDEAAAAFAQGKIWQPYDIHGELSQYWVYKLDRNRHLVIFRMNHILLDGAGMAVHLLNSIAAAHSIKSGQPYVPAPVIYPDYVQDNTRRTDTTEVIAHWREVSRAVEALDFPLPPQARQAAGTGRRIEKQVRLDDAHWAAVQQYCEQQRITPSLYFKALYGLLINAYCRGEADFVVSEVVGGRTGQHKRAFGNYFQVLPVVFPQSLFAPGHQVDELFAYIRNYRKSLRSNANVSLLTQRRTLPQGRLHFMFNYYNFIPSVELFGTRVQLKAYPQVQDGPVQFVVHEQDGWMELNLIYLSDLFADLDFLRRIEMLSQQIVSGVASVDALELVLPQEKHQQTEVWNNSAQTLPDHASILTWFDQQAQATPNNIAVKQGSVLFTYAQLQQKSNQLANWLLQTGVQKGQKIGICLDRSPDMLVAVLGALKAGAAYVPMDSEYPPERLAYMLEDSKAPVLLTQKCVVERLQQGSVNLHGVNVVQLDQQPAYLQAPGTTPSVTISGDDPIYVIYTSGSTGKPKGAVVRHSGEVNLQHWYINALNISAQDKFLLVSAFGFDLTQKNLFAPLLTGGTLVIPAMENYDVEVIADTLQKEAISIVNCAPSAFYPVVEETARKGYPFPALRYLVLGGEPIRMNALQAWLDHPSCQCKVVNSYGPTECTDVVSYHINQDNAATVLPIGKPVCNTQLYIVGAGNHLLPEGVVGELCVAGNGVGLGYLDRPELTASVFQNNPFARPGSASNNLWYRTGDLARYWTDGNIEYIGRKDFQIKLRGLRIELGEIEHALRRQEGVSDSLTLVRDDQLVSYVIAPKTFDTQGCRVKLRNALPDYMVPAHILVLERWPLTPNGKVDRNALPSPTDTGRGPYVAPRNETEEKLAAIWSEVLGVDRIGVHDSFFDLGGHSLLAARAVSKFRHTFNVDIPLRALFELHTIADIAQYLETLQWAAQAAETSQQAGSSEGRDEGFL
ncbi:MAG: amino acid adenylation domain-containing protein [Pseudomonadota bacterium]